jgi:hypothetical protein
MEYSHVQKRMYGTRHRMKEKKKEGKEERTPGVLRNKD